MESKLANPDLRAAPGELLRAARRAREIARATGTRLIIVEDGILLRPCKVIDSTQAWFWQPEWQAGEREAAADLAAGRSRVFESSEAFLASLEPL